ncbi:MAG: orotidine-5'-phosphate decarboxylase [Deltaproteobacteria bacterium]|nr:orotidine-5'-phosphate decarboxylase [Deltaproteobacteria bacterium]
MKNPKDYLIFPLDFPTYKEAIHYIEMLKEYVGIFKVGLELFVSTGPKIIEEIKKRSGADIFLDLKFHDIPATVRGAFLAASRYNVRYVTVHCDKGEGILQSVGEEGSSETKILGVTVLTSLDGTDLSKLGYKDKYVNDVTELVMLRAAIAKDAGCSGVICSPLEVEEIKAAFGADFIAVTPGIRPLWSLKNIDDQRRILTPEQAIKNGADHIVIGRPIRMADNPAKAAEKVLEEIKMAIS